MGALMTDSAKVGKKIREMRKAAGLTQRALAERVGLTRQTIIEIEKGRDPLLSNLEAIARACGRTWGELDSSLFEATSIERALAGIREAAERRGIEPPSDDEYEDLRHLVARRRSVVVDADFLVDYLEAERRLRRRKK